MFTCSATFAAACQIAVWLANANATLLPPYWRFEPHHIKAIVDTAYEESGFRHCIKSRDGSVGLWQWRGSRREYLHQKANTPPTICVPAESQVRFMIDELLTRREAPAFFAARDYRTARSIFVRGFEVRRMDLIRRAGL
jgi:hypothetical protein